jgi:hypothetical protein
MDPEPSGLPETAAASIVLGIIAVCFLVYAGVIVGLAALFVNLLGAGQ